MPVPCSGCSRPSSPPVQGTGGGAGCGLDVASAAALGGDAGERGEDQRDAEEEEPDSEDEAEHRGEGTHAHHEGPDGRVGEGVDLTGSLGDLGVAVLQPVAHAAVPEEVVAPGQEAEQRGAEQHDAATVLVAPEPVDEPDQAEEGAQEQQEQSFDPHTDASTFLPLPCPLVWTPLPCGTLRWSGWL